jgi:hypothetical protein
LDREDIRKRLWPNDTIVEFDHSIHTPLRNCARHWETLRIIRSMSRR